MEFRIGNLLTLTAGNQVRFGFQNYRINESLQEPIQRYDFLPFGFSGVTVNRTGDNTEASLLFPNNALSKSWGVEAIRDKWIARVTTIIFPDPSNLDQFTQLSIYIGKVSDGGWDNTALQLSLNTVIDAVGADIPTRRLTQKLIGSIPVTSNVAMQ